jgi:TolB-like protein/DNA-binding SARP family transcriptional activator
MALPSGNGVHMTGKIQENDSHSRIALLGGFVLTGPDRAECPIPSAKARALLCILALSPNGSSAPETLASLLWSDRQDAQARDSLKHALADLRTRFTAAGIPQLDSTRNGIRLDLSRVGTDITELEQEIRRGPSSLSRIIDLYRGDLLAGTNIRDPAFEDWLRIERQRFRNLVEEMLKRLIADAERSGDAQTLFLAARRLLDLDPFDESAARTLMEHHARVGEQSAALRVFNDLCRIMKAELGSEPTQSTFELARAIRNGAILPLSSDGRKADALQVPRLPSIAVLPFRNLSGNADEDYFADGIAEDIVALLSRYRWFFVIARNSSFAFRERRLSEKDIGRELGVRYLLDGSVRRAGGRVRLTSELIDAEQGVVIWSERYDRDISDLLALQDELARHVVGAIEPEILRGESTRAASTPGFRFDAYDCHMRGVWHHNRQDQPEDFDESIRWQRKAIALDPQLSRAYMILSRSLYARSLHGFSADLEADRKDLLEAASRAVSLEPHDAYAHYAMSIAHLMDLRPAAAVEEAMRAVELSPNFALAQNALGWSRIFAGNSTDAIGPVDLALRLSPRDPVRYFFQCALALAYFHMGDHATSVQIARQAVAAKPRYFSMLVLLAGLVRLDLISEAESLAGRAKQIAPRDPATYWKLLFPYATREHRTEISTALQGLGISV